MQLTTPPKPQTEIIQKQQSFEQEAHGLKELLDVAETLKPNFKENVDVLERMHTAIEVLKKDMQKAFNDIGIISDFLKQEEEKNKQLRLDIIEAVKEENEKLPQEIEQLQGAVALCTLGLDTAQNVLDEQKAQIAALETETSKLVKFEAHVEAYKTLKKDISLLQEQISFNNKSAYNDITNGKTHTQILGVLSIANFAAVCVAFWIWWQTHRV